MTNLQTLLEDAKRLCCPDGYVNVGDGCWRRNVLVTTIECCDGFGRFCRQHPLSFYISVRHQHSKDVTNIPKSSLTLRHQHHDVTKLVTISLKPSGHIERAKINVCDHGPLFIKLSNINNNQTNRKCRLHLKSFLKIRKLSLRSFTPSSGK